MIDLRTLSVIDRGVWLASRPPLGLMTKEQRENEMAVRWGAVASLDVGLEPTDDLLEMLAAWCIDPEAMALDACETLLIEDDDAMRVIEHERGLCKGTLDTLPCINISAILQVSTRALAHQLALPAPNWSAW